MEERWRNIIIWAISGMAIVIPLLFNPWGFYYFEVDKIFFFRFVVSIIFVFWLMRQINVRSVFQKILEASKRASFFDIDFLFVLLVLSYGLSAIFSIAPADSFWGSEDRNWGFLTILSLVVFFWLCGRAFADQKQILKLFKLSAIVAAAVSLYGIFQKFGFDCFVFSGAETLAHAKYVIRPISTLGHPNYIGAYLAMIIPWTVAGCFIVKELFWKIVFVLSLFLQMICLYFTLNRGGWLAVIAGMSVYAVFLLLKKEAPSREVIRKKRLNVFAAVILAVITISFFSGIWGLGGKERNKDLNFQEGSIYVRLQEYKYAWGRFLERPVLGWGSETYKYLAMQRQIPEDEKNMDPRLSDRVHNFLLDHLISLGVLGLSVWLAIFLKFAKLFFSGIKDIGYSDKKNILVAVASSLAGYFVAVQFHFDTMVTAFFVFLNFCFLKSLSINVSGDSDNKVGSAWWNEGGGFCKVAAFVLFIVSFYLNVGGVVWNIWLAR